MKTKIIFSRDKKRCAHITRKLLPDGYNYYILPMQYNDIILDYCIIDNYRQPEILTYKDALEEAKNFIDNIITYYQLPNKEFRRACLHPDEFNRLHKEYTELTNLHPVQMFNRFPHGFNGYIDSRINGNYSKPTF